jgi:hypothetical protein
VPGAAHAAQLRSASERREGTFAFDGKANALQPTDWIKFFTPNRTLLLYMLQQKQNRPRCFSIAAGLHFSCFVTASPGERSQDVKSALRALQDQRQNSRYDGGKEHSDEDQRLDQKIDATVTSKTARILAHSSSPFNVWKFCFRITAGFCEPLAPTSLIGARNANSSTQSKLALTAAASSRRRHAAGCHVLTWDNAAFPVWLARERVADRRARKRRRRRACPRFRLA